MEVKQGLLGNRVYASRTGFGVVERVQFALVVLAHKTETHTPVSNVTLTGAKETVDLSVRKLLVQYRLMQTRRRQRKPPLISNIVHGRF